MHGRTGQPCPVCGDTVREVSFADSSLQYCPTCQTGGKPLADRRLSRLLKLKRHFCPNGRWRVLLAWLSQRGRQRVPLAGRHLGAIAQLEERLVCIQKARGSSPLSSTIHTPRDLRDPPKERRGSNALSLTGSEASDSYV